MHQNGANSMAMGTCRKALVSTGRAIGLFLAYIDLEKKPFCLLCLELRN